MNNLENQGGVNKSVINWYPGHMTKAVRQMKEDIKLIDLVIELLDARIPLSSRNPDIDDLGKNKARLVLLNKSDLADETDNNKWIQYFKNNAVQIACKEKIERDKKRGIINRPVRAMVVGIPNVGKSTFINAYAGRAAAKTGNKPGVTKGKQWIKLNKNLELLDTPGILWPKFDNQTIGMHLAFIGSINDNILDVTELAYQLVKLLATTYPKVVVERYKIEGHEDPLQVMYQVAEARGCKLKGNQPDLEKTSKIIMDDFRAGKLGRITLDKL